MRSKKILAIMLCAITVTSTILSGCGDKGSITTKDGNEIVNLTWYAIGAEPKDLDAVEKKINEYAGEKIGVNVDMKFVDWGDYEKKTSILLSTGGAWDLIFTCSWAANYLSNSRKGVFLELEPYLEQYGADMVKEIDERFWTGAKIDGKTYAVPNQKELGVAPMWIFDKTLVEKYNIPYEDLHTIESLEPWLKIIKENEPDYVPFFIAAGTSFVEEFDPVVEGIGFRLDDEDLKVINFFETQEVKDRLHTLSKYYKEGYINADSNIAQDDVKLKKFVTKGDGQPFADRIWSASAGREVVTSSIADTWVTNISTTGSMLGINKNTKHPEKAVEFLNLLNTDEYLRNLVNYGIEDVHYNLTDKGQVKPIEPKMYDVSYMSVGNLFKTKTIDGDPENKWDEFKKFNDDSKIAPSLGFNLDTSSIQTELAAIGNVMQEFKALLYGGGSPNVDKTLKDFNKRLYDQGLQKVMDEIQKQVDAWKASK